MSAEASNVHVMVRVRLFNDREKNANKAKERLRPCVRMRGNTCAVIEYLKDEKGFTHEREREAFEFTECFWSIPQIQVPSENVVATQLSVYERSGKLALQHAMEGYNVCIFAYGQTGSGKTYSMLGSDSDPGISPRLVDDLFRSVENIQKTQPALRISVECMFFEIYNEKVRDLFNKQSKSGDYDAPRIRTHRTRGVYVEGLLRKEVNDAETAKKLIEKGTNERAMAETKMNAHSSRSHAIFQLCIVTKDPLNGTQRTSFINLVDLAGSEKISLSGVQGQALKEAMSINKSLSTLRRVFDVLIENTQQKKQMVPPFRDSVLTHVLSDSLGGNSKTQMLATISPHVINLEDTIQTLRYANQAKAIVCEAKVNEEKSAEMVEAMRDEIDKLRRMMVDGVSSSPSGMFSSEGNAELQKELQEKEAEFSKMIDEQAKMEEMVSELKSKMEEMDAAKQQLSVAISRQKSERFAAAFRNAFLLSKEKKSNQAQEAELQDLRIKVTSLSSRLRAVEHDLTDRVKECNQLSDENERMCASIDDERSLAQRTILELQGQNRMLQDLREALSRRVEDQATELSDVRFAFDSANEKVDRLELDLGGAAALSEREKHEKSRVKDAFHSSVGELSSQLDILRRRKEMYKQQATEEKSRVATFSKAIEAFQNDRGSYAETIRAQQSLLNEKAFLLETTRNELYVSREREKALQMTLNDRDETIRILNESVQQYQDASLKFMSDITQKDQEIDRLRGLCAEARDFIDVSATRGSVSSRMPAYTDATGSASLPRPLATGFRPRANRLAQPHITRLDK